MEGTVLSQGQAPHAEHPTAVCHIPVSATSQEHHPCSPGSPPAPGQGEAGGSRECTNNTPMQEAAVGRLPGTSYPRRHPGPGWVSRDPAATTTHRTPKDTSPPSSCPYKPCGAGGAQGSLLPSSHLTQTLCSASSPVTSAVLFVVRPGRKLTKTMDLHRSQQGSALPPQN